MNGDDALTDDLALTHGLRGLARHLGPEEPLPGGPGDLAELVDHAIDALPDEGDRLARTLGSARGAAPEAADPIGRHLPFCGRRDALEVLYNAVRDAVAERRLHVVEVTGARGLGKTRLLAEALAIIDPEARGIDVLPMAARPGDGPQALLAQLVRRRFGIQPRDGDKAAYERIIEALEPLFDERLLVGNARLLGHLAGLRAMGPGADALPADLEAFRRQAFKALIAVFRLDLAKAARILVLQRPEPIGALDDRALETLLALVTELADEPLVLAVLGPAHAPLTGASDAEAAAPPAVGHAVVTRVALEPLGERDVERLVRSLFDSPDAVPALVKALADNAGGNPRIVIENARLLVQRGALVPSTTGLVPADDAHDWATEGLAGDLDEASTLRVQALVPAQRHLLEAAAIFGRAFPIEGALAVASVRAPELAFGRGLLERLVHAGMLRVEATPADPDANPGAWRFSHASDRVRLLAELGDDERALMHALTAQWLEARPLAGHDPGAQHEAVAAHWLRTGRVGAAANALVRAGEVAREALLLPRARSLFRSALEVLGLHTASRGLDRAPILVPTLLAYADLALKTGEFQEAKLLSAGALEGLRALEPRPSSELGQVARAWLLLGRAHRGLGAYGLAKGCLHRSLELARRGSDARGSADALSELARVHWVEGGDGGYAEASRLLEEALVLHRELGAPRGIAETLGLLANIRIQRGDFEGARVRLEEASVQSREAFDLVLEAKALMSLGAIAYFGGDYERALEVWKDGLRAAEIAGERELIGAFLNNLGETRLARGELEHAAAALLEAREVTTETGDLRTLIDVLKNLSGLHARRGELSRAQSTADEAFALATAMNARPSLGPALRARAEVRSMRAIAEGSPQLARDAEADFRAAIALFESLGDAAELARTQAALANHLRVVPPPG